MLIDVARDAEGLEMAALQLFEEGFDRHVIAPKLQGASETSRARIEDSMRHRTLSDGYYAFVGYLFELESLIECGAGFHAGDLGADETAGLRAIRAARRDFESKHPTCGGCGERQYAPGAPHCRACGAEFRRS